MEQIKRQPDSSFNHYGDSKRQKIQATTDETNCISTKAISCFEDLANELIYEIFEFLDYFHVYQAFFDLNLRFHNLLIHSNLAIKTHISSMSKSAFKRYNRDIIQTNIHRISSLYFSDAFSYEFVFSSLGNLPKFSHVKRLSLQNIESEYLENLLYELSSLSLLSSLAITSVDDMINKNTIYHQIFRLTALKYCRLSSLGSTSNEPLPVCTNDYSSIEYLVITNPIYLHELDSLLSYVPYLRRLSFHSLSESSKHTKIAPRLLNYLTHVSLKINSIKFHRLEQMVINIFRTVQVLRFTIDDDVDRAYMDGDRWKRLISSHIPNLKVFDIHFDIYLGDDTYYRLKIESQINRFTSPFWMELQWFFAHYFYQSRYENHRILYSTNPYRRKYYAGYKKLDENADFCYYESNLNSIQHVHIQSEESIINCMSYFPNVTELNFNDNFSFDHVSILTILDRIIPLKQLTKLVIGSLHVSFEKLIELLYFTPNIHTLILDSMSFYKSDHKPDAQSETFQLVSNRNVITNVTCNVDCTLEQIKLLIALCPRMQHLTIDRPSMGLVSVTRFLLDKTKLDARHLCSLCFPGPYSNWYEVVNTCIKSEKLVDDYTLKRVGGNLYLWW